jgi:hypothetical protein
MRPRSAVLDGSAGPANRYAASTVVTCARGHQVVDVPLKVATIL